MTPQWVEPGRLTPSAPKTRAPGMARLWGNVAVCACVTAVWLALALVAAARGDFIILAIDVAGVIAAGASLTWGVHLLLQMADAENLARFACRIAEQRFEALLADFVATAERGDAEYLQ